MIENVVVNKESGQFFVEFIDGDVLSCPVKDIVELQDIIFNKTHTPVDAEDITPIFIRIRYKATVLNRPNIRATFKKSIIYSALPEILVQYDFDFERVLEIVELLNTQDLMKFLMFECSVEELL